jgi:hypothetical protein
MRCGSLDAGRRFISPGGWLATPRECFSDAGRPFVDLSWDVDLSQWARCRLGCLLPGETAAESRLSLLATLDGVACGLASSRTSAGEEGDGERTVQTCPLGRLFILCG